MRLVFTVGSVSVWTEASVWNGSKCITARFYYGTELCDVIEVEAKSGAWRVIILAAISRNNRSIYA